MVERHHSAQSAPSLPGLKPITRRRELFFLPVLLLVTRRRELFFLPVIPCFKPITRRVLSPFFMFRTVITRRGLSQFFGRIGGMRRKEGSVLQWDLGECCADYSPLSLFLWDIRMRRVLPSAPPRVNNVVNSVPFLTVLACSFFSRNPKESGSKRESWVRTIQFRLKVEKQGEWAGMWDLGLFYLRFGEGKCW